MSALDVAEAAVQAELRKSAPAPLTTGIVDVHADDGVCDLAAFKAGGGVAYISKATEGGDFTDRAFAKVMPRLKEAGLLAGAYHFGNGKTPVEKQAAHFLRTVEPYPEALLILDCETNHGSFGTMSLAQAVDFLERVHAARGRWPVFYTFTSMLAALMRGATDAQRVTLSHCPLWIAQYGPEPTHVPAPWPTWDLWQYTSSVDVGPADQRRYPRGVPGFARKSQDRSCFRGTPDDLALWWKRAGLP